LSIIGSLLGAGGSLLGSSGGLLGGGSGLLGLFNGNAGNSLSFPLSYAGNPNLPAD
jgi:hypothetical protein